MDAQSPEEYEEGMQGTADFGNSVQESLTQTGRSFVGDGGEAVASEGACMTYEDGGVVVDVGGEAGAGDTREPEQLLSSIQEQEGVEESGEDGQQH